MLCELSPNYRNDVTRHCLILIYSYPCSKQTHEKNRLLEQNFRLDGNGLACRIKGEVIKHSSLEDVTLGFTPKRPHQDIRMEVVDWWQRSNQLREEESVVRNFLTSMFNLCKTPSDFLAVLPGDLHHLLHDSVVKQATNYETTVHPEQIEMQHKAAFFKGKDPIALIKERLLLNIIT